MSELLLAIVETVRRQPYLLLSSVQLILTLVAILWLLPRRWQLLIGFVAILLLAIALIGRMS